MSQDKYKDKNARTYQGKNVITFPVNNAKMFQGKNAEMCHDKFKEKSAETSPGNSAITFQGNNAKMCQDKFVNKLDMAANNFFQIVDSYRERSLVIITSPISIMLYQSYVIFILMSNFRLKHNLVN